MSATALLVMDVQAMIVGRYADGDPGYLDRLAAAIAAARQAGHPVIYVTVGFRPGHPEISSRNKIFAATARAVGDAPDDATRVHPAVAPAAADPIVVKRRVSAFAGGDLDVLLRGLDVDTLVLTGIATSGVVLSTLRQAADLDFRLVVLADACLDADPEVHRVLTEKVFPRQAEVRTVADWVARPAW
jgi:nicotinamidase-related amidase